VDIQELRLGGVEWIGLAQDRDEFLTILMPCTLAETWQSFV
jgi:hypothetical protein